MRVNTMRALVTGAAGGIGSAIVSELLKGGAEVLMVDRDASALATTLSQLPLGRERCQTHVADLTDASARAQLSTAASAWRGGVNVLINNAGLNPFGLFEELSGVEIDSALAVNVLAPIHLCHAMLPHLRRQAGASILNIGSVFGSIGYPGYATYSATKFAMRGFTEALRRELATSGISVHYLAPRATRTRINSSAVEKMNAELGVAMDAPETVARAAIALLADGGVSAVVGWPEKLFVRINALWPALVDGALRRQLPIIQRHARRGRPAPLPNVEAADRRIA